MSSFDVSQKRPSPDLSESDSGFSRALVLRLLKALEEQPLPDLTPNEHSHLLVLIQATLEVSRILNFSRQYIDSPYRSTNKGSLWMQTDFVISPQFDLSSS